MSVLTSCTYSEGYEDEINPVNLQHTIVNRDLWYYSIIEYNGHEYLSTENGGIVHTESCKCKQLWETNYDRK